MTDGGNGGELQREGVVAADNEQSCSSVFVTFGVEDDHTHALTGFYARRGFDVVGETVLARRLS